MRTRNKRHRPGGEPKKPDDRMNLSPLHHSASVAPREKRPTLTAGATREEPIGRIARPISHSPFPPTLQRSSKALFGKNSGLPPSTSLRFSRVSNNLVMVFDHENGEKAFQFDVFMAFGPPRPISIDRRMNAKARTDRLPLIDIPSSNDDEQSTLRRRSIVERATWGDTVFDTD